MYLRPVQPLGTTLNAPGMCAGSGGCLLRTDAKSGSCPHEERKWITIILSLQLSYALHGRGSIGPRTNFPRNRAFRKNRLQDMSWSSPHHMRIL